MLGLRFAFHLALVGALTIVTQIGGVAWLAALLFRRVLAFGLIYTGLTLAMLWIAPIFGRVPLTCWAEGPLRVQSWTYCALNRTYMRPELLALLTDAAEDVAQAYPGTETLLLDASFPLFDGFPLLPHLSHDDGGQADLAFYYADETGYLPGATRSPLGYFAFEDGPTQCPDAFPSLRWNMRPLQPLWRAYTVEPARMRHLLATLSADPRVGRIFIEPHMVDSLGAASPRIGFQGCRAARHDDHIHLQL